MGVVTLRGVISGVQATTFVPAVLATIPAMSSSAPILLGLTSWVVTHTGVIPRPQSSPRSTARSMASERDTTPSFW
jgi:hypothetical protein